VGDPGSPARTGKPLIEADRSGIPCIALCHNEMSILPDFLAHYRSLGVTAFFIVDDRSQDGSREFLSSQPDVTLFEPKPGSTYAEHKRAWRAEILDVFADGQWCLAPDIDEHLVYRDFESVGLPELVETLQAEGAEALHCTMLDMYAEEPLAEHRYTGGGLVRAFPLTDGPDAYIRLPAPRRYRMKYPTPIMFAYGGMRDRIFYRPARAPSGFTKAALRRFANIDGRFDARGIEAASAAVARRLARPYLPKDPFVCSKLTLLRWQKGQQFSGGSHSVRVALPLSRRSAALLHFKFSRGVPALEYNAARGQHAGGGAYYRQMLDQSDALRSSPVYAGTVRYEGSGSLRWILR
jgi:hypothetical protein